MSTKIKEAKSDFFILIAIYILLGFAVLVVIYPLYFTIIASFSDPQMIYQGDVILIPKGVTFEAYERLFQDNTILLGYRNSIVYTVTGTFLSVFLTLSGAFALAQKELKGRKTVTLLLIFTMFFNGGIIPTYLVVRNFKMVNTMWALILPNTVWVWNLIIARTFFQLTIPQELQEAAIMDGASYSRYYYKIVLPLSKALVAVMLLYYGIYYWNMFFQALIYINDERKYPLQLILRSILLENETLSGADIDAETQAARQRVADLLKYSSIIVATLPMLIIYPFLQKYFTKGVMIGSVKG